MSEQNAVQKALGIFNGGLVDFPDVTNPRGYVTKYFPEIAMERVLYEYEREISDLREKLADALILASGKKVHASDCATSQAPAMEPSACDCRTGDKQ